jgi:hypothetical protein
MSTTSTGARFAHQSRSPISQARRDAGSPAFTLNILIAAKRACQVHDMPVSLFGRLAANDPRLITDMENGRVLRPETEAKVRAFIAVMDGRPARQRRGPPAKPIDITRYNPRRHGVPPVAGGPPVQISHREAMTRGSSMLLRAINGARKGV